MRPSHHEIDLYISVLYQLITLSNRFKIMSDYFKAIKSDYIKIRSDHFNIMSDHFKTKNVYWASPIEIVSS